MHRFPSNFLPEKQGSHGVLLPSCKILFSKKEKKCKTGMRGCCTRVAAKRAKLAQRAACVLAGSGPVRLPARRGMEALLVRLRLRGRAPFPIPTQPTALEIFLAVGALWPVRMITPLNTYSKVNPSSVAGAAAACCSILIDSPCACVRSTRRYRHGLGWFRRQNKNCRCQSTAP